ncbi:TWO-COMPONENT RESPONSE REGULATOR [Salix purpurea]|uniref:TWO-COMPONENT RESPONSE REGULATOR n=1 Tax=Salix purpurea TaxID=77065 RepID=A0A9Q0Z8W7_SALPP|nr:TWO-COMPONENT RESPONSE REGULATOR [Salix purpurea]
MSTATSGGVWKVSDGVSDQFSAGLRVLVVDDDLTCLVILEKMLRKFSRNLDVSSCLGDLHEFMMSDASTKSSVSLLRLSSLTPKIFSSLLNTKSPKSPVLSSAAQAREMSTRKEREMSTRKGDEQWRHKERELGYDIVISDVQMPDMDGFKLLEDIGLEMDLPVINKFPVTVASDGFNDLSNHEPCSDHVVRKRKNEWKDLEQSGSVEEGGDRQQKQPEDADFSSSANDGSWKNSKRRKDEEEEAEERDDPSALKKPRVLCRVHGYKHALEIKITILGGCPQENPGVDDVPRLTGEIVASHLQKYRLYLRRLSRVSQHQNGIGSSFICPQEATYGPLSSLNGLALQTLAAAGQLPDKRNLFSFENPKLRFGEGEQQHLNNVKQMNLLHGSPTTMEPNQLANLHHSAHVRVTNSHVPRLPSSIAQPITSNALASGVLAKNGLAENGRGIGFNPVSQSFTLLNFPLNTTDELTATSFPLGSAAEVPSLTSNGTFREEISSEIKGPGGFMPSYDIFNNLQQHRSPPDWKFQNVGMTFNGSQQSNSVQRNLDVASSVLSHQGFSSCQSNGQSRSISAVGKPVFPAGDVTEPVHAQCLGQPINSCFAENSMRVKTERVPDANPQNALFNEQFGQEDLMSALLRQVGFLSINTKRLVLES